MLQSGIKWETQFSEGLAREHCLSTSRHDYLKQKGRHLQFTADCGLGQPIRDSRATGLQQGDERLSVPHS